jgi:hypothetical protein
MPIRRIGSVASGLALTSLAACVRVEVPTAPAPQPPAAVAAAQGDSSKRDDAKKGPFKPWEEVLKDTRAVEGLFTFHLKRDNTLFLELRPAQLGREFGLVMHYSRGIGDFDVHDGLYLDETQLLRFERRGDHVYLVRVNPRFTADSGSPLRASLEQNVGHSVLGAFKVEAQRGDTGSIAVDVTGFFVSDYADVGRFIKPYYGNKPVTFDKARSHVSGVMGFPRNVEVDVALTYQANDPPVVGGEGVSDYRSIPLGIRYSLFALPERPMRPRLADDRVGLFLDAVRDFSRDRRETQFVRYVTRWRLEKRDHGGDLSEPVQPIVYYIDHSVPFEYRRYVREGIEAWNTALEGAGFRRAIVARDAPDDSTWSAEDVRYSTVRWTAANRMGYAIGPSQTDPRTGEILNADILISSAFVQSWLYEYQELAGPDELIRRYREAERLQRTLPPAAARRMCFALVGRRHQLGLQYALLVGLGVLDGGQPMPLEYLGDAIRDLVMHEVGHTLGLRHNFRGSSAIPHASLHDTTFTRQHGVTLSVMDYGAVNVAVEPARQGHYWNQGVGPYDIWAIRYAYAPVYRSDPATGASATATAAATPEDELPALRRIAEEAADPEHAYGTDEDNWLGPFALDPRSSAWDLGSDPLQYARDRAAIIERVTARLEERLVAVGDGYQRLRGAVTGLLFERFLSILPLTKVVGGMYVSRAHRGDPGGEVPFTAVPAETQRAAVALITSEVLGEGAFHFDPSLLNKLAPSRWAHWGVPFFTVPLDYPVHSYVALVQLSLLDDLLSPPRLARMVDNELRAAPGAEPYRLAELLATLTEAVWSELDGARPRPIDSFRRNLQRGFLEQLIGLVHPTYFAVPQDAVSLARYHLRRLSERMASVLAGGATLDDTTRAHLVESRTRIERALEATMTVPLR